MAKTKSSASQDTNCGGRFLLTTALLTVKQAELSKAMHSSHLRQLQGIDASTLKACLLICLYFCKGRNAWHGVLLTNNSLHSGQHMTEAIVAHKESRRLAYIQMIRWVPKYK
jgi:hypothetical protein